MNLNPYDPSIASPMGRNLPAWVETELAKLRGMKTGDGINNQLWRVAKGLAPFRDDAAILATLREATANCGRQVPEREIVKAIISSKARAWLPPIGGVMPPMATRPAPQRWPEVNNEQREAVISGAGLGFERADLWACSPVQLPENSTEAYIDALFPGNPLLCVGKTSSIFATRTREEWRGKLTGQQFIVPSPMSRVTGTTQDGKPSQHCLDNTGPRRFAVIECDKGSADEQAAILYHLRFQRGFPLVLVVHSGGKSLHGWFNVLGLPEARVEAFYRHCVSLGADRATYTRSQFVRLPDGLREDGQRQTVDYFDPSVLPKEAQS